MLVERYYFWRKKNISFEDESGLYNHSFVCLNDNNIIYRLSQSQTEVHNEFFERIQHSLRNAGEDFDEIEKFIRLLKEYKIRNEVRFVDKVSADFSLFYDHLFCRSMVELLFEFSAISFEISHSNPFFPMFTKIQNRKNPPQTSTPLHQIQSHSNFILNSDNLMQLETGSYTTASTSPRSDSTTPTPPSSTETSSSSTESVVFIGTNNKKKKRNQSNKPVPLDQKVVWKNSTGMFVEKLYGSLTKEELQECIQYHEELYELDINNLDDISIEYQDGMTSICFVCETTGSISTLFGMGNHHRHCGSVSGGKQRIKALAHRKKCASVRQVLSAKYPDIMNRHITRLDYKRYKAANLVMDSMDQSTSAPSNATSLQQLSASASQSTTQVNTPTIIPVLQQSFSNQSTATQENQSTATQENQSTATQESNTQLSAPIVLNKQPKAQTQRRASKRTLAQANLNTQSLQESEETES